MPLGVQTVIFIGVVLELFIIFFLVRVLVIGTSPVLIVRLLGRMVTSSSVTVVKLFILQGVLTKVVVDAISAVTIVLTGDEGASILEMPGDMDAFIVDRRMGVRLRNVS